METLLQLHCSVEATQHSNSRERHPHLTNPTATDLGSDHVDGPSTVLLASVGMPTDRAIPSFLDVLEYTVFHIDAASTGAQCADYSILKQLPLRRSCAMCERLSAYYNVSQLRGPHISDRASSSDVEVHTEGSSSGESTEDEFVWPSLEVRLLLDECTRSVPAACRLFWLLQTTVNSPGQSLAPSARQKKSSDSKGLSNGQSPIPSLAPSLADHTNVMNTQSSTSSNSSERSGSRISSLYVQSSSRPSSSNDTIADAMKPKPHRSTGSAMILHQFMSRLQCRRVDAPDLEGHASSSTRRHEATTIPSAPIPHLIYTIPHTYSIGSTLSSTRSLIHKRIVDTLHKQSRLMVVIRRCVNLVKSPHLMDASPSMDSHSSNGSMESCGSTSQDPPAVSKEAMSPPTKHVEFQAKRYHGSHNTGLFTNPSQSRNAVLPKAIRLSIMADARMHNTPLFPVQNMLVEGNSNSIDETIPPSQLLHGIKISEVI